MPLPCIGYVCRYAIFNSDLVELHVDPSKTNNEVSGTSSEIVATYADPAARIAKESFAEFIDAIWAAAAAGGDDKAELYATRTT